MHSGGGFAGSLPDAAEFTETGCCRQPQPAECCSGNRHRADEYRRFTPSRRILGRKNHLVDKILARFPPRPSGIPLTIVCPLFPLTAATATLPRPHSHSRTDSPVYDRRSYTGTAIPQHVPDSLKRHTAGNHRPPARASSGLSLSTAPDRSARAPGSGPQTPRSGDLRPRLFLALPQMPLWLCHPRNQQ